MTPCAHAYAAAADRLEAVLDGIFNERDQQHRRKFRVVQRVIGLDRERETRSHAHLEQIEVRANDLELATERCVLRAKLRKRRTQIPHQADDRIRTRLRLSAIQAPHIAEHVEQEMRLDLRLEHLQARFVHLLVEKRAIDLGLMHRGFARLGSAEVDEDIGEQPAKQRGPAGCAHRRLR